MLNAQHGIMVFSITMLDSSSFLFKATVAWLAASSSSMMKTNQREFHYVPYGTSFSSTTSRPTVSCDGRIPGGVTLELTHWTGNQTPNDLYADTSTEMALKLARQNKDGSYSKFDNALILNNHYDTDGVLSVWACLEPELALKYAPLLVQGAEAGDFGEWSSEQGIKLDCTLGGMLQQYGGEEEAYQYVLQELPKLLNDLQETNGENYKELWKDGWENANEGWQNIKKGKISLEKLEGSGGKLIVVSSEEESSSTLHLSPYALHRGLKEHGLLSDAIRILKAKSKNGMYEYEKVGHGWVQKLVQRPMVPPVNADKLVKQLNTRFGSSFWRAGGSSGLVAICQTLQPLKSSETTQEVARVLLELDPGFQE